MAEKADSLGARRVGMKGEELLDGVILQEMPSPDNFREKFALQVSALQEQD
jgi:hypothetical protein